MIIGFDVSKNELVGTKINKRGDIQETYVIGNNQEEINNFLNKIIDQKLILGSEATAEYHNLLAKSCLKRSIPFYVLNPIVTKQFTKATVRKRKTDLSDAYVIAKCLLQGEGERVCLSSFEPVKPIIRTAASLAQIATAVNHMKKRFVEHFPEEILVQNELDKLNQMIEQTKIIIRDYGYQRTNPALQKLLCSLPGIGDNLASVIISEIGDIRRFKNAKTMVAYAGLDPKVRQSGLTLKRNTHLTKRGSPYLRRALYIAASIAQRCDQELKLYYEKKRSEGKRYKEATVANARHMLFRIYAVWKRQTPYIKLSTNP